MAKKFSKFTRPDSVYGGRISERDLQVLEIVLRYRFSPVSELLRLCGGNHTTTKKRLTWLWRKGLIGRFAFVEPKRLSHSEFHYFIDNRAVLDLLVEYGRIGEIHPQMEKEVRQNREAGYSAAWLDSSSAQLLFLRHQLMISRLRFMLEMSCWGSGDKTELSMFRPDLDAFRIKAPALAAKRAENGRYEWAETDKEEKLPIKPDAIFTLTHRGGDTSPPRALHFAYEADRSTMPLADMMKKLRAYHFLIKRYKQHEEAFGLHPIRAVLIEVPDEKRAVKLMELASHPLVCGQSKRSGLFWFVPSFLFTMPAEHKGEMFPRYLVEPDVIFSREWALPEGATADGTMRASKHSLLDGENS